MKRDSSPYLRGTTKSSLRRSEIKSLSTRHRKVIAFLEASSSLHLDGARSKSLSTRHRKVLTFLEASSSLHFDEARTNLFLLQEKEKLSLVISGKLLGAYTLGGNGKENLKSSPKIVEVINDNPQVLYVDFKHLEADPTSCTKTRLV